MKNSTLCYIEKDGSYLMLHRTKKEHDENKDKWIGVGGKFEEGESPFDCVIREVKEETGLSVTPIFRGIVTFVMEELGTEYMHLFTANDYHGTLIECAEGELAWVEKQKVCTLPIWEGDKIFLQLLARDVPLFFLTLRYDKDGNLLSYEIQGGDMENSVKKA